MSRRLEVLLHGTAVGEISETAGGGTEFRFPDRVRAAWSPLYDQVATVAWRAPARALALELATVKDFGRIDRDAFELFAGRARIDRRRTGRLIGETLDRLRQAWNELRDELPVHPAHRRAIEEHWKRVPLLRAAGGLGS